jgi:hypothetical protein
MTTKRRKPSTRNRRSPPAAGEKLRDLIVDMEEPLKDALGLAEVLLYIGMGLDALEDDAATPVIALAVTQKRQMTALIALWDAMFAASGRN